MGQTYAYACEKCGYAAEVSGGKDRGFTVVTVTRLCRRCLELADVFAGEVRDKPGTGNWGVKPATHPKRCPKCGSDDTVAWKKRLCPKCGGKMINHGTICMWD